MRAVEVLVSLINLSKKNDINILKEKLKKTHVLSKHKNDKMFSNKTTDFILPFF